MSRARTTERERAVLFAVPCPLCIARRGEWCAVVGTAPIRAAKYLHFVRIRRSEQVA